MKKLLLAGAIALMGVVNAQEVALKGKTFVTGQLGYVADTDNGLNIERNTFSITPVVGHFVTPTVAVGGMIGYSSSVSKVSGIKSGEESGFSFAPMVRKYWSVGNKLYLFGQLAAPMSWETDKISDVKTSTYGVNVAPGLDYFITNKWSLETVIGSFGYSTTKVDVKGAKSNDDFNFGVDLYDVKFGVKYVF